MNERTNANRAEDDVVSPARPPAGSALFNPLSTAKKKQFYSNFKSFVPQKGFSTKEGVINLRALHASGPQRLLYTPSLMFPLSPSPLAKWPPKSATVARLVLGRARPRSIASPRDKLTGATLTSKLRAPPSQPTTRRQQCCLKFGKSSYVWRSNSQTRCVACFNFVSRA